MPIFNTQRIRAVVLSAPLLAAAGCGKPATAEDCERIATRITELELQAAQISDPGSVKKQLTTTKEVFSEAMQRDCVGKRISATALECVENATTSKQIVEECFN